MAFGTSHTKLKIQHSTFCHNSTFTKVMGDDKKVQDKSTRDPWGTGPGARHPDDDPAQPDPDVHVLYTTDDDEDPAGAPGGVQCEPDPNDLEAKKWRESQARVHNRSKPEIDAMLAQRSGAFDIPSTFSTSAGSFTQTREGNLTFDPHHG
jgi:hypothetical protein